MIDQDCRSCKDWQSCIGKDWYHYGEIRWCPWQVLWILQHAETLKAGRWPTQEELSHPNSPIRKRQFKTEGYFVKSVIIIAELKARLKTTGLSGKLLKAQAKAGDTIDMLELEAREALMYVSGWRQKAVSYPRWKAQWRYRRKVKTNESERVVTNSQSFLPGGLYGSNN